MDAFLPRYYTHHFHNLSSCDAIEDRTFYLYRNRATQELQTVAERLTVNPPIGDKPVMSSRGGYNAHKKTNLPIL